MIVDTQILSYYFKGRLTIPSCPIRISSITAAEFLLVQAPQPSRANYYPILPSMFRHVVFGSLQQNIPLAVSLRSRRSGAFGKGMTDRLVLDFGASLPSFIEFGSYALTLLINEGHEQLYRSSVAHLGSVKSFSQKLNSDNSTLKIGPAVAYP